MSNKITKEQFQKINEQRVQLQHLKPDQSFREFLSTIDKTEEYKGVQFLTLLVAWFDPRRVEKELELEK